MTGTYVDELVAALDRAGDRPVVRRDGRDTTGRELLTAIYRYARALDRLGVGRGSLVALFAPNRPEALAVRYAANLIGAGTVYLSAPAAEHHRAALLRTVDPQLLVVFPETADLVPAGTAGPVVAVGDTGTGHGRLDELAAPSPATRCRRGAARTTSPWWRPPAAPRACRRAAGGPLPNTPRWCRCRARPTGASWPTGRWRT